MMFIAGNLIEIVNLKTFKHTYLRSTSGGGIGALVVSYTTVSCYLYLVLFDCEVAFSLSESNRQCWGRRLRLIFEQFKFFSPFTANVDRSKPWRILDFVKRRALKV